VLYSEVYNLYVSTQSLTLSGKFVARMLVY